MSTALTDIAPLETWGALEKDLHEHLNMNCAVFDSQGMGVTGKPNWCNRLCPVIKGDKNSLAAICAPCNQALLQQAKKDQTPAIGECDAGLVKFSVPIILDGEFLGVAGGCGRLPDGGEPESFLIQKITDMNEETYKDLTRDLERIKKREVKEAALFVESKLGEVDKRLNGK